MKAKIISILLLSCLSVPIATLYMWLQYQKAILKKEAKRQVKAGIAKNELVLLKFSKKEVVEKLKWEDAKEFEYEQQMYDVVEEASKGDTVYYWCWLDSPETVINIKINEIASHLWTNDLAKQEKQKNTLKFYSELFFVDKPIFSLKSYPIVTKNIGLYESYCTEFGTTPDLPPPKS